MMFDLSKFYISACSNSVQYVRIHPILMSILLYHHKQLTECILEVEQIEVNLEGLQKKKRRVRGSPAILPPTEAAVIPTP
jgi:hypothetical protein